MTAAKTQRDRDAAAPARPSVGFEQRIFAPHSMAAIVSQLGAEGIDPAAALDGTGLAAEDLNCHKTRICYRQLDIVIRNALRLSGDPAIGLRAGQRMHITAYGMYGYALLSCPTRAHAREFATRYIRAVGPFCDLTASIGDTTVTLSFRPLHWPNPTQDVHRFVVEFALSAHLTASRDRFGPMFMFTGVFVDYKRPRHADVYHTMFDCPVAFERCSSGYDYDRDDRAILLADARTHAMAREMCEQLLEEVNRLGGIASDIRQVLIQQPGQFPSLETIAKDLGVHPRALRRKLEAAGTSYRELLAEVRMKLGIEYLRKTKMTNDEIAARLGYSDASNFRHAFIRWTGKNPSDFRTRDT